MKIEFFSKVYGVADTYPILNAKDIIPNWVQEARMDYVKSDKRDLHIFKCPGIIDVLTAGFVVTAWHDTDIESTPDKMTITIPDVGLNELLDKRGNTTQLQTAQGVAKYLPKRPWSQKSIVKINTPWHVLAPRNVKFMFIPLPYTDQFLFESTIGILDPGISSEVNVQGYWNVDYGKHTIKAGTPLCQIIPLTEKQYSMVCRDMNNRDELWLKKRKFLDNFSFVLQRNKLKEAYYKHIKS